MRKKQSSDQLPVTMKAVAALAGVSTMSVSNVLNGRKVLPRVREAVMKAVEELDFKPNETARRLRRGQTPIIGILDFGVAHPFLTAMMLGALTAAVRHGAQLLPQPITFRNLDDLRAALRSLKQRGANAVLIPPVIAEAMTEREIAAAEGMPLMAIAPGVPLDLMPSVRVDDQGAAREMTELLIEKGHRRIGFIRADATGAGVRQSRYEGYKSALEAHGIALQPELVIETMMTFECGLSAAGRLLDLPEPPTAILGSNDDQAAGALVAAHTRHLAIPEQIAIAGFDDSDLSRKVWPPLTTVHFSVQEMAEKAVDILVPTILGHGSTHLLLMPHQIVRRASTGD